MLLKKAMRALNKRLLYQPVAPSWRFDDLQSAKSSKQSIYDARDGH